MARGRSGESVEGPEGDQVGLNGLTGACTGVVDQSREPAMGIGNDVKPRGTERTKRKPGALEGGADPRGRHSVNRSRKDQTLGGRVRPAYVELEGLLFDHIKSYDIV